MLSDGPIRLLVYPIRLSEGCYQALIVPYQAAQRALSGSQCTLSGTQCTLLGSQIAVSGSPGAYKASNGPIRLLEYPRRLSEGSIRQVQMALGLSGSHFSDGLIKLSDGLSG